MSIQYNTEYIYSKGKGKITFTEGKNGLVEATYSVYDDQGTIKGKFDGEMLVGSFHSDSLNRDGLINFTFSESGFVAKWKNGLELGAMRGKWTTDNNAKKANPSIEFNFDIHTDASKLDEEVERIFTSRSIEQRDAFVEEFTEFINHHPHYFWLTLSVYYKAQNVYYAANDESLEEFYSGFLVEDDDLNFKPQERFELYFHNEKDNASQWESPSDYKWSKGKNGKEASFLETVVNDMKYKLSDFSEENDHYVECRNAATTYLWISLQKITLGHVNNEELATCLWSVFDIRAHELEEFNGDANVGQDAVDNMLAYILRIDKEEFNVDENPSNRDDLEQYDGYIHDYLKISQEILDMDIFDL